MKDYTERPTDMTDDQYIDFDMEFYHLINKYLRTEVDRSMCGRTYLKICKLRDQSIDLINEWNAQEIK